MENKQMQQAKDTIAKKYGYENFEQFDDKSNASRTFCCSLAIN